ncbi:Uncharacterised protein [Vibrio cholerae]|nr:Uncharacterised protein [Vibrio cholerae]
MDALLLLVFIELYSVLIIDGIVRRDKPASPVHY